MRKVVFRVDANSRIGLGHLSRCGAIKGMIGPSFQTRFVVADTPPSFTDTAGIPEAEILKLPAGATQEEEIKYFKTHVPGAIIVLDGYHFPGSFQASLRQEGFTVVLISDYPEHVACDVVINHCGGITESSYSSSYQTRYYLGPGYALLRQEFLTFRSELKSFQKILITMGGADNQNLLPSIVSQCLQINSVQQITAVAPPARVQELQLIRNEKLVTRSGISAKEMASEIASSSLMICSASISAYEGCAIGIPMITIRTADNQQHVHEFLKTNGLTMSFDKLPGSIKLPAEQLLTDLELMQNQLKKQSDIFDGRSPERIKQIFVELAC